MTFMKIYISHSGNYNYKAELYEPIKQSTLYKKHQIFLPHEPQNINLATKDIIASFDLLVAEVSRPSTGQGIEIGLASAAHIPIVGLFQPGTEPSSALKFYVQDILEYSDTSDLLHKLTTLVAAK